jgi:hypothetical protein
MKKRHFYIFRIGRNLNSCYISNKLIAKNKSVFIGEFMKLFLLLTFLLTLFTTQADYISNCKLTIEFDPGVRLSPIKKEQIYKEAKESCSKYKHPMRAKLTIMKEDFSQSSESAHFFSPSKWGTLYWQHDYDYKNSYTTLELSAKWVGQAIDYLYQDVRPGLELEEEYMEKIKKEYLFTLKGNIYLKEYNYRETIGQLMKFEKRLSQLDPTHADKYLGKLMNYKILLSHTLYGGNFYSDSSEETLFLNLVDIDEIFEYLEDNIFGEKILFESKK